MATQPGVLLGANTTRTGWPARPQSNRSAIVGHDAQEACTTVSRTSAELFPKVGKGGSVDPDRVLRHNLHGAVVENDRLRR
jgi:hypothetical protein